MGRFPILIVLAFAFILGCVFFFRKSGESKPVATGGGSKQSSSSAVPTPTPMVQVMTAALDHRFKDELVTTEGEILKEGAVIKQGIVASVHGANATVLRPDGGTTWIGTDKDHITTEMVSSVGTVTAYAPEDGIDGHLEAVMTSTGAVYRLGRECRQGVVVSIRPGEIRIEREDGGIHLIGFGSSKPAGQSFGSLSETNSFARAK